MASETKKRRLVGPYQDDTISSSNSLMEVESGQGNVRGNNQKSQRESTEPMHKTIAINRVQKITVKHFIREWYELDTGLHGIPAQHNFNCLFDQEFYAKLNQASSGRSVTWLYLRPFIEKFRISNPIVLSDNIQTGTGVNEVSSFVQNHKILHFKIKPHEIGSQYYFSTDNNGQNLISMTNVSTNVFPVQLIEKFNTTDTSTINDIYINGQLEYHPANTARVDAMSTKTDYGRFAFLVALAAQNTDPNVLAISQNRNGDNDFFRRLKNYDCSLVDSTETVDLHKPQFQSCYNFGTALFGNTNTTLTNMVNNASKTYTTAVSSGGTAAKTGVYGWAPILKNFGPRTITDTDVSFTDQELRRQLCDSCYHDYFTLVPIRKTDGSYMQLRASVMVECEFGMELFFFPRTHQESSVSDFVSYLHANENISPGVWPNIRGYSTSGLGTFLF